MKNLKKSEIKKCKSEKEFEINKLISEKGV